MLVLSRRSGERLVLIMGNQRATIQLLAVSGNRARVGIDAPNNVRIVREAIQHPVQSDDGLRRRAKSRRRRQSP